MGFFGRRGYFTLHSLISIAILAWLWLAFQTAPYQQLWTVQPWMRWLPVLVMPVVCYLMVAGLSSPNPFSLSLSSKPFDPKRPGIVAVNRHPVIVALMLWAGVHIIVNGDASAVTLFSMLVLLCVAGLFTLNTRRQQNLGHDTWRQLSGQVRQTSPVQGFVQTGIMRLLASVLFYILLLSIHAPIIGASPLPLF